METNRLKQFCTYTDCRRFNVQLVTGPESSADCVVYLDNQRRKVKKYDSLDELEASCCERRKHTDMEYK